MAKTKAPGPARPAQVAAELAALMPDIANILYRLTQGMACPDELSLPQFKTLQFIHTTHRDLKMSELSRMLGIASSTLTETVKRLVADGYLTRERSVDDDRMVLLGLTTKGRGLVDAHIRNLQQFFTMICEQAGPQGAHKLLAAHQFIHDTYHEILQRQTGASEEEEEL